MKSPEVSVIIPTYNRRELVQRALDSVFAQTCRDFEVIVVDDGSTDGTRAAVEGRPGVRYLFQDNAGPARARNVAMRQARGELIAFLDSDDVWWPDFLETQIGVLERYRDVALVCARSIVGTREAKHFPLTRELVVGDLYAQLYAESFVRTPATVIRRSCLDTVGDFNESYPWSEDHDLWLRIAAKHSIAYVNRCLVRIGREGDNMSRDLTRPLDLHLKIALEVLERNYDPSRIPATVYRERIAARHLQFSRFFFARGESAQAWRCIRRALRVAPCSLRPYRYMLKGILARLPLPAIP
jgi:glycosyltransferase involved in cell wall biosynthesis